MFEGFRAPNIDLERQKKSIYRGNTKKQKIKVTRNWHNQNHNSAFETKVVKT